MLRAKAESAGNLKSTPEQVVTTREEGGSRVIYIAPTNPERIYVPVYNSSVVFDTVVTGALVFGTAVLVGSAWNNRWGWNNRSWNQVWIRPPGPGWRPPVRPIRPPPGAWRPGGPGRPPGVRPDRPGVRPPGQRPDRPGTGVRPDRPGVRPDRPTLPGNRPERPGARPDRPGARPDRPAVRPDRPAARPERPAARPGRKRVRSDQQRVPRRGHRGPQHGHNNDLHPARASSPRARSHDRADLNSARRYSGQPTVRTCSVLRPIDPDRRGRTASGATAAPARRTQPAAIDRHGICSQLQSVRADVATRDAVMARSSTTVPATSHRLVRLVTGASFGQLRPLQRRHTLRQFAVRIIAVHMGD